jgi:hypothetical protein
MRKHRLAAGMAAILLLSGVTPAFADQLVTEKGDGFVKETLEVPFGSICVDETKEVTARLALRRQGGGANNTWADDSSVALRLQSITTSGNTDVDVSPAAGTQAGSFALPSDWDTAGTTTDPIAVTMNFTPRAEKTDGRVTFEWEAVGTNQRGNPYTETAKVEITFTATVCTSAPLEITSASAHPEVVAVGEQFTVTADFTGGSGAGYQCTLNTVGAQTSDADGMTCTAAGSYAAAGIYTPTITVTDGASGSDSETVTVVVYDPSAGFVTGGGWFTSGAGAYIADPALTGKASFGFVSKYQRGAKVPTGNTQFRLHVADFSFHSSSYEWLVVAGSSKAQYKGQGAVNGVDGFGFMLTAHDGGSTGDAFKIKIWDGSGTVVYDSGQGVGDAMDAGLTALGGGSIVIHVPKK